MQHLSSNLADPIFFLLQTLIKSRQIRSYSDPIHVILYWLQLIEYAPDFSPADHFSPAVLQVNEVR